MLTYTAHDIDGNYRMNLPLMQDRFNSPLRVAGQLTGNLHIPDNKTGDLIKRYVSPDATVVYANWDGAPIWGGIFTDFGEWDPVTKTLPITCAEWRAWFGSRLITPNPLTGATRDAVFTWTNTEQLAIAASLVYYACDEIDAPQFREIDAGGLAKPISYTPSGVLRDASWDSTSFKSVLEALDELSHRQGGFDWGFRYVRNPATGSVQPVIEFWYPERLSPTVSQMFLSYTPTGGNILMYRAPMSASRRVARMWGTGAGVPPDQVIGVSTDPNHSAPPEWHDRSRPYREAKRAYTSVSTLTTLQSHTRTELQQRKQTMTFVDADTYLDAPDIGGYMVGDRSRLKLQDEWLDIDVPSARILHRSVVGATESDPPRVTLTLDVTDAYGALVEVE